MNPVLDEPKIAVVKIGGSLLDYPELAGRLRSFLKALGPARVILVAGGGPVADIVRARDRWDRLDRDIAHWLAVRAMTFNSHLIAALLPDAVVVPNLGRCSPAWTAGRWPIIDPHLFLISEEESTEREPLPRDWSTTSDTIAARIARASGARDLILLKSVSCPSDADLSAAAGQGIVDEQFAAEVARCPALRVRIENLRRWAG